MSHMQWSLLTIYYPPSIRGHRGDHVDHDPLRLYPIQEANLDPLKLSERDCHIARPHFMILRTFTDTYLLTRIAPALIISHYASAWVLVDAHRLFRLLYS
jgi:hypothetical protein